MGPGNGGTSQLFDTSQAKKKNVSLHDLDPSPSATKSLSREIEGH